MNEFSKREEILNKSNDKAVVLLSGGLDSALLLDFAIEECSKVYPLVFSVEEENTKEVQCAKKLAKEYDTDEVKILEVPLREAVNRMLYPESNYISARNMIFLSYATAYAETLGVENIYIGANAEDYANYPDCRYRFLKEFGKAIRKGTKSKVRFIHLNYPLIDMDKELIVKLSLEKDIPIELTWSCYLNEEEPCGECDSCKLRAKAFKAVGKNDPLLVGEEK